MLEGTDSKFLQMLQNLPMQTFYCDDSNFDSGNQHLVNARRVYLFMKKPDGQDVTFT